MASGKIPLDPLVSVAARFKRQRQIERFTQAEIADDIGVNRSLIAHFEMGISRLSFAAGYAFCRRANINPRWLATGAEPQRPFISPLELGLEDDDVEAQAVRGVDYLTGYDAVLAAPLDQWAKAVTVDDLIGRQLEDGPAGYARRCSDAQLQSEVERWAGELRSDNVVAKAGALVNLYAMLDEFAERLKKKNRSLAKFLPPRRVDVGKK
jgi:transcriptional regulator with XRE-family HTH domain